MQAALYIIQEDDEPGYSYPPVIVIMHACNYGDN